MSGPVHIGTRYLHEWTIGDLGFAHRLGRWKRNPNRDGISPGKPWDGGHPVRRSGSITHWASAREHHSVLHLGWQTTKDHLPPGTYHRATLALSLPPPGLSSSLPSSCPVRLRWYPYPTADPGHTLMPTSRLFSLFIKPTPSLRLRGGTNPSCPSTVSPNPVSATIQNIINACSCSKVGSSASSLSTTAAALLALYLVAFLDALSEIASPPSPTFTISSHIT